MTMNYDNLGEMVNILENKSLSKWIQGGIEKYEFIYLLKKLIS